eukprot:jgi/Botrbrau1/21541/Bobra.174_2s0044.1
MKHKMMLISQCHAAHVTKGSVNGGHGLVFPYLWVTAEERSDHPQVGELLSPKFLWLLKAIACTCMSFLMMRNATVIWLRASSKEPQYGIPPFELQIYLKMELGYALSRGLVRPRGSWTSVDDPQ